MQRMPCQLQYAAGRVEECPGQPCPFWDEDRCVIAGLRVDLGKNSDLTHLLLKLRAELGGHARTLFGLLPPGSKK
jgi:hypothetical protein